MLRIIAILLLITAPAIAQTNGSTSTDAYWQQFLGALQGQCAANVVSLAKQVDEAKKQIADLQRELDQLKKK